MAKIIIRSDDFDFRLDTKDYIAVHEEFLKRDLIETVNLQFAQFDRLGNFRPELIEYMKNTPNYDFQIHGWQHDKYSEMELAHVVRDLAAAKYFCWGMFGKLPTIWYPPWNCYSENMKTAADSLGMTIDNESYDIAKFIREVKSGEYTGHSFYFHAWQKPERELLTEALDLVLTLQK
jgi:peptidoglycan/xylan/chitin deacetylase (PgdA/CDA1 family)